MIPNGPGCYGLHRRVPRPSGLPCGCRKLMPPGDIHGSRLRRGLAAGCGSGPGWWRHLAAGGGARPGSGFGVAGAYCRKIIPPPNGSKPGRQPRTRSRADRFPQSICPGNASFRHPQVMWPLPPVAGVRAWAAVVHAGTSKGQRPMALAGGPLESLAGQRDLRPSGRGHLAPSPAQGHARRVKGATVVWQ